MENARWWNSMGNPATVNRNSDTALNTVLFLPDSLQLDNIKSSIDVSHIEDIRYLQEKLIAALGLPKGYLLAEDTSSTGSALAEQDRIFAGKIPYIQTAYLEGVEDLLTKIAFYVGADLNTLKINVIIETPHRLTDRLIEQNTRGLDFVKSQIAFYKEMNPDYQLTPSQWLKMIQRAGLDPEVYSIPVSLKAHSPGSSPEDIGSDFNLGQEGGEDTFGNEPIGFDAENIGTKPFGESMKYLNKKSEDYSDKFIEVDDDLVLHSKLYNYFVKAFG